MMLPLIAQAGEVTEGASRLTSGEYGVLGVIVGVLFIAIGIGAWAVWRSNNKALAKKDDEITRLVKAVEKKDTELAQQFEARIKNATENTEAMYKATETLQGVVPLLQTITGQLQALLARGG